MARTPFYGRGPGPAIARMDMNTATAPGRANGGMYANMGKQVGGAIEKYGLNKEKRNKLQATLEGQLSTADPSVMQAFTMTGDEAYDKKNQTLFDKVQSGNASIPDLERANGLLAGRTTQENAMMKKSAFELSQLTQQLLNDNTRLRNEIGGLTKKDVVAQSSAKTRMDEGKADITETTASYLPNPITTGLRAKDASTDATLQRVDQGAELFPLVKQYKEGQIEYQELLKKRLLINSTQGLSTDNTKTYQDVTKQIDDIMNDFGTVKDGEALKIEDMIEDITDSGEIILRQDISVQAQSSIPRLQDLLKKKYELDQSRVLEDVPMKDGTRRDMTQSEFNLMMKDDRKKQQQSDLLKQAQMQAGSGYNVQPPTMFK